MTHIKRIDEMVNNNYEKVDNFKETIRAIKNTGSDIIKNEENEFNAIKAKYETSKKSYDILRWLSDELEQYDSLIRFAKVDFDEGWDDRKTKNYEREFADVKLKIDEYIKKYNELEYDGTATDSFAEQFGEYEKIYNVLKKREDEFWSELNSLIDLISKQI